MGVAASALYQSQLKSVPLVARGKVRDIYQMDPDHLLIVATDRISAFDVVLPDPIPDKGIVLTAVSNFWFDYLGSVIPNHLTGIDPASALQDPEDRAVVAKRSVIVQRAKPLPVEAVVRGYLIGSGWKDYCQTGKVCGLDLPAGLDLAEQLRDPIFTPSTKAAQGHHDENISIAQVKNLIGVELAEQVEQVSTELYTRASAYARARNIIIADTKFEFGITDAGELILIDELLTPDSSRFWPTASYRTGISPPSFDKQYVRDYLETLDWNKQAPGPHLPAIVVQRTREKYHEVLRLLTESATP
jgi:phosphoribosylaminoimidazole-succinocarboxamide synthase